MESGRAPESWTAIVLAGGRGRRLGGTDKAALVIGGSSSLEHILNDLPAATPVIVVGPARPTLRPVTHCQEDPPGGGPVAGIAAALPEVGTPIVALLATDMPWAGRLARRLVDEFDEFDEGTVDALVPVDAAARRQPLCAVAATEALRSALARLGDPRGQSMRRLLAELAVQERQLDGQESLLLEDIDTPADLGRARSGGRPT